MSARKQAPAKRPVDAGDPKRDVRPRLTMPRWLRRLVVFVGAAAVTAFIGTLVNRGASRWFDNPSGPALRFSTEANAVLDAGESWVLPEPLSPSDERWLDLSDPADFGANLDRFRTRMATQFDGIRLGTHVRQERQFSPLQATVEGRRRNPVRIRDMRARVTGRQPPLSGTLIYGIPQGEQPVIEVVFDLDAPAPVANAVDESGRALGPYFAKHVVTLSRGEKVVFGIRALTATCYCEWEIDVHALVDGNEQRYTVRDGRRPLRVTAWAPRYQVAYSYDFEDQRFERRDACRSGPSDDCLDSGQSG